MPKGNIPPGTVTVNGGEGFLGRIERSTVEISLKNPIPR
jgi:hypothetical protein